jgi:hypothetical protein
MKPNDLDPRVIKLRNLFWLPENYQYEDPLLAG